MKPSARDALALGLALAAAWLAHQFVLGLTLVGWDTYPIIAASRVTGPGDISSLLTEEWMGGRYPRGHFYRPASALSFAFDHAVWGLEPWGYQWTNLGCLLFAVTSVYALARVWLGSAGIAGIAALIVAIHPAMLEVVPIAARRSDLLALAFVTSSLALQRFDGAPGRIRVVLGALCAALAVGAKETGAVVIPAVLAAHFWLDVPASPGSRLRRAAARGGPAALAALGVIVLRTTVVSGLGGHPDSSLIGGTIAGVLGAGTWIHLAVVPQPWTEHPLLDFLIAVFLAGGLGFATWWAVKIDALARSIGLIVAVWAGTLLVLVGISGDPASWYVAPLVAPYALLLALVARTAQQRWRTSRPAASAAAILVALLVVSHIGLSEPFQGYERWPAVSKDTERFLRAFDAALADAQPGDTVTLEGLPVGSGVPIQQVGIRSALGLADYSVAAYAELAFPDRAVRIVIDGTPDQPATSGDVITVRVIPLAGTGQPE